MAKSRGGDQPQDPTNPATETETPLTPEERVALLEKPFEKGEKGTIKPFFRTLNPDGTVKHHFVGMPTLEELQQKAGAKEWLENELGMTVEARAAIIAHRETLREQGYTSKQIEAMDDARQRRLGGRDGGPEPGDIWTKADLDRGFESQGIGGVAETVGRPAGDIIPSGYRAGQRSVVGHDSRATG